MRIVCCSDSHCQHQKLVIPECDLLIHAGDFTLKGSFFEVRDFIQWFEQQNQAKHRILIAGNHELSFDPMQGKKYNSSIYAMVKNNPNFIYLENSSIVIDGYIIYGTPWTPFFHDWAFNGLRKEDEAQDLNISLQRIYNLIDPDVDILICHGPPFGILDRTVHNDRPGSKELLDRMEQLKKLKLVVSGHIHEGYGIQLLPSGVTVVNASVLNRDYKLVNNPIILDI